MKLKPIIVVMLTLLLVSILILLFRIQPVEASSEETVVYTVWSEILNVTSSWNDTDPGFGTAPFSGECNVTVGPPDANGVRNMTFPKESGYIKPRYNPIIIRLHM